MGSAEGSQGSVAISADFTRSSLNVVRHDPWDSGLPHFRGRKEFFLLFREETEAHKHYMSQPKSHSESVAEFACKPNILVPEASVWPSP